MRKRNYEFITLNAYIENIDDKNVVSLNDKSIEREVEKYFLSLKRAETNAKIVQALVGQFFDFELGKKIEKSDTTESGYEESAIRGKP